MNGLARTFQVARTVQLGDEQVRFARLEVEADLAVITADVIAERRASAVAIVNERNSDPDRLLHIGRFELLSILQKIVDNEPAVGELYQRASTPKGAAKVCRIMLKKAGYDPVDVNRIIKEMRADVMVGIAQDGILCAEPEKPKEDNTPPLTSIPSGSAPAIAPHGIPSEAELQAKAVGYGQSGQ